LELIENRPRDEGQVIVSEERSAAIDAELAQLRPALGARIADTYRASLYEL
jgi:hypothetical protein